jgi:hypothetical protein
MGQEWTSEDIFSERKFLDEKLGGKMRGFLWRAMVI